jgi:hypothetical protein
MGKIAIIMFLAQGFLFTQESTKGIISSETVKVVDSEDVPTYEYVPKVIIEGKWGGGPGEFGRWVEMGGEQEIYEPSSLAVDSKGNIYILDIVNERIQKFDSDGKYIKSIPVESFSGKRYEAETTELVDKNNPDVIVEPDNPNMIEVKRKTIEIEPDFKVVGINIVIDSKDNLYYYLKRSSYSLVPVDLKDVGVYSVCEEIREEEGVCMMRKTMESGEVWEFKDDKLVRKWEVPLTNFLSSGVGLELDRDDDSLWIPNIDKKVYGKSYDVRNKKILTTKEFIEKKNKFRATEAGKKVALKPIPKYYLDIEVTNAGIKVVRKKN